MGHSYGGNAVLFHGALDERIQFACAGGAAGSYADRQANQPGIELAEVIPGFASRFDTPDLLTCFASRRILMVSATDDPFHTLLIIWLPPHRRGVLNWAAWRESITTAKKVNML